MEGKVKSVGVLRVTEAHGLKTKCRLTAISTVAFVRDNECCLAACAWRVCARRAREDEALVDDDDDVVVGTRQLAFVVHAQVNRVLLAHVSDRDRLCDWYCGRLACEIRRVFDCRFSF